MPSPTETKPIVEAEEFDLLAFWIQHKRKVLIFTLLLVIGLLVFGIFQYMQYHAREAAARDFANATTVEDLRRVAVTHSGSAVAGNALLLVAERLRSENKLDESTAVLKEFVEKFPDHPLISGAWMSLAVNLEAQEKNDDALVNYQKVVASYPTSFSAPGALMAQARIYKAKGKIDEAKRAYESVIGQYPDNIMAQVARQENQRLKK
jgi:TolA-binding protein